MSVVTPLRTHDTESNFVRAYKGQTLQSSRLLDTARRIVVVSPPISPGVPGDDEVAIIELPPARRWQARELTIVGTGFCLAPAAGEYVQGDVDGRITVRLVPLLNDRCDERDYWAVVG
jgi:hypothetical protein